MLFGSSLSISKLLVLPLSCSDQIRPSSKIVIFEEWCDEIKSGLDEILKLVIHHRVFLS